MRKAQKQQAVEMVRQMEEAHGQIKKYIEQNQIQAALDLLEDCQNGGIAIGNLVESTEGENHPIISLLEAYCETIYQIYRDLTDNTYAEISANKIYKNLRQRLIKAANSLNNDIHIRKEAVFLPYKASMWDSLESVWKAADEDPDCDAYVIPISYFNKNPDGSFREMHYEGDEYPEYVPITKYDEFDLEWHHPDMIFIHNPYDIANYVTSVHPDFYSDRLKQFTDKLIYIPYFVVGEMDPDSPKAVDSIRHFCFTPVIINADRVIVESEAVRQIYIKNYIREAQNCGFTGEHTNMKKAEKGSLDCGHKRCNMPV